MNSKLFIPLSVLLAPVSALALEQYDVFDPIVEINASDGDVGFHFLLGGEPYRNATIFDPYLQRVLISRAATGLKEQGMSELFLESAEPPCWANPEADADSVISTVADFVERFEAGIYFAFGRSIDKELLVGAAMFTHDLPAAPVTDAAQVDSSNGIAVEIHWEPGSDLGVCPYDDAGIPDPASVEVVRWEVAFEPDVDDLPESIEMDAKYVVQVPGNVSSVTVPAEFIGPWLDAGVTEFKYEVGAKEAGGNQTFTENSLEIE